ncbi:DNA polymerase Y family protein [Silvibacterium dinghuense]|uniref:DNA polymerase n=1 Tax=Silvibacterium dinghuense TaxID=1560006 RepID=A0A4Q1SHZ0_9BACT|nr:DNA polymerase [Silvibacterium dinghuense]RXS97218.1 DNA polymerase [Silvibacterium dinghuense]GGG97173.1 DNA polymerase IV [Silvibacterium dinghuense]
MPEPHPSAAEPRIRWLFLDLNSYFASVEQELRPELRGRPVAVVPVMADTTCAIAASYEAKAFGVKTGTQVAEARRLCPGIQFIEARHDVYVKYHKRIVEAVEQCVPVSAVLSIDEMASSLMGREQPLRAALALARRVKQALREQVGETLRCSIGLAPNRYLAKIASDMEKPDGLVALTPDLLPGALERLKLRDLPGVGARMEKRLHRAGIRTMEELLKLDRERMNAAWGGIQGEKLWYWLRGEDFHDAALAHKKSISQSHVLPPELRTLEGCYAVAQKLLHKAATRLRAERLWTASVALGIRFQVPRTVAPGTEAQRLHSSGIPQEGWSQGTAVVECQDSQTLVEALRRLWELCPKDARHRKPFYVGVWLGNLVPDHLHTLDLFGNLERESKRTRLTTAMDSLNARYGLTTLMPASMLLAKEAAPTRIAFTNIPDLFE